MPRKASMLERRLGGETKSVPVVSGGNWFEFKLENIYRRLKPLFCPTLRRRQRVHVNIIFSDFAVKPRTINPEEISGRLLVAPRTL